MTKEFDSILEKPVWDEFDENTHRIRRNLLIFSSILLTVKFAHLRVNENALLFGFPLTGLTTHNLLIVLGILTLYHICHFALVTWDYYLRWKIKITGFNYKPKDYGGYFKVESVDSDEKNSTLYTWWLNKRGEMAAFPTVKEMMETILNSTSPTHHFAGFELALKRVEHSLEKMIKFLNDERLETLKKFDKGFWLFQRIERIRWMGLEVALPLYLGMYALIWL